MDSNETKKKKTIEIKRYFLEEENDSTPKVVNESDEKKKRKSSEEIVKLKSKKLHKEKKKVVSSLKSLHEILGKTKPPDEEETELQNFILGGDIEDDAFLEDKVHITEKESPVKPKMPAWVDPDDEKILIEDKAKSLKNCHRSVLVRSEEKYSDYVQEKFKKIVGEPTWAELGRKTVDSDDDSDEELLKSAGNYIKSSDILPKSIINIRKCTSLTDETMKGAIVKTVEFHPSARVALVTGTNGIANLYQVDGKINSKIQSIYFDSFPIHTAHFTADGNEIVAGSNAYGYYYVYDMLMGKTLRVPWQKGMEQNNVRRFHLSPDGKYIIIHGRYGNIHLVTTKSKEWIGSLKMNGEVVAVDFNKDGTKMYSHGTCGEVYIWDLNSRKCMHKFTDEGCITGTSIASSPNDQFLATGSDSGIVNVYDCSTLTTSSPVPIKVIKNLTTEITSMKFNVSSELLAIGSSYKIGAVRLVQFPSMSAFSNFPVREEFKAIKNVNSLDISPNSGFFMMGNNTGNALLYRFKHYKNY